jgi:hypothetical protein
MAMNKGPGLCHEKDQEDCSSSLETTEQANCRHFCIASLVREQPSLYIPEQIGRTSLVTLLNLTHASVSVSL